MSNSPKFKINDPVLFKNVLAYVVKVSRIENNYFYGISSAPNGTVFIDSVPEQELSNQ